VRDRTVRDRAEDLAEHLDAIQGAIERARWGAEPREVLGAIRGHMRSISRELVGNPPPGFLDGAWRMTRDVDAYEHEPGESGIAAMLNSFALYRSTAEGGDR
jgi:hypothetical protein